MLNRRQRRELKGINVVYTKNEFSEFYKKLIPPIIIYFI